LEWQNTRARSRQTAPFGAQVNKSLAGIYDARSPWNRTPDTYIAWLVFANTAEAHCELSCDQPIKNSSMYWIDALFALHYKCNDNSGASD